MLAQIIPNNHISSLSIEQHAAIFASMPDGLLVLDSRGVIIEANSAAHSLLDTILLNQPWREIIHSCFMPKASDGHEVSLRNGKLVKVATSPLQGSIGQLIVLTDLTETRQLQAKISHMQRLSSLGQMVAKLAHQIRTPLSAALLYAENLNGDKNSSNLQQRFSQKLLARLKELEMQVNDMLVFAKSGQQPLAKTFSVFSLQQQIESNMAGILAKHKIALTFDVPAMDIHLLGNQDAIAGALQNILHNAVQVSAMGDTVTCVMSVTPEHNLRVTISDNGPGLKPEHIPQLFTPFYTTKTHGTGLGLAVVASVIQSHKGTICAKNKPNNDGAEFICTLPLATNVTMHNQSQESLK